MTETLSSVVGDVMDPTDLECSLCMRLDLLYSLVQTESFIKLMQ